MGGAMQVLQNCWLYSLAEYCQHIPQSHKLKQANNDLLHRGWWRPWIFATASKGGQLIASKHLLLLPASCCFCCWGCCLYLLSLHLRMSNDRPPYDCNEQT